MSNILNYRGYRGVVQYDADDGVLFGKIEGINALVTFEAETLEEVKPAFKEAVDNYLSFCKDNGIEPEKEFRGQFNVRVSPELHRQASLEASAENITLNKLVENALASYLKAQ